MIVWSTLTHNFSMESFHKFYCRAKSPWKERLIFKAFQVLVRIIRYEDTTNFNQYRLYTVQYIYIIHDETLLQNHFFVDLRAQCNYSKIVASYRRKITVFLGETQLSTPVVPLFSTPKLPKKVLKKGVNVEKRGKLPWKIMNEILVQKNFFSTIMNE